jgi:hypothetical protein
LKREKTNEAHQGKLLWREYTRGREPPFALVYDRNEQGFVPNEKLLCRCHKNIADTHGNDGYKTYLHEDFLDNLSPESIIMLTMHLKTAEDRKSRLQNHRRKKLCYSLLLSKLSYK